MTLRLVRWAPLALVLAAGAEACGMSTHNEVTQRAFFYLSGDNYTEYRAIAERHAAFIQAGTYFPDWGYGCFSNDNPAEDAHWPQYQRAFFEAIMDNYSKPWSKDAEKAIAFFFGMVSHSVADILWHSMGILEGFIPQIARLNAVDNYGTGHDIADAGGEFVLRHITDLDYLGVPFQVPVKIVKAAYAKLGKTIKTTDLALCMARGYAGALGNKIAGEYIYPIYAYRSPVLVEQYEDYFVGGMNDMSVQTAECYQKIVEWLENRVLARPHCLIEEVHWDRITENPLVNTGLHTQERRSKLLNLGAKLAKSLGKEVHVKVTEENESGTDDLTITVKNDLDTSSSSSAGFANPVEKVIDWIVDHLGDLHLDISPERIRKYILDGEFEEGLPGPYDGKCKGASSDRSVAPKSIFLETRMRYAGLGRSIVMGDFDGDGDRELAIGAPYYNAGKVRNAIAQAGAVFIVEGDKQPGSQYNLPLDASTFIEGTAKMGRFGYSLAVVDLNMDGVDDLAVSSPTEGAVTLSYRGKVRVYLGQKGVGLSSTPALVVAGLEQGPFDGEAYKYRHTVLGSNLFAVDVDQDGFKDLIIGSPYASPTTSDSQEGRVYIFLASTFKSSESSGALMLCSDADIILPPPGPARQLYSHFGSSVAFIEGSQTPDGAPLLLVGSPAFSAKGKYIRPQSAGAVFAYRMGPAAPTTESWFMVGSAENGQLGSGLAYLGGGRLAVSSPSETLNDQEYTDKESSGKNFQIPPKGWNRGAVRVMDLSRIPQGQQFTVPLNGTDSDSIVLSVLRGERSGGRFGHQLQAVASQDRVGLKDLWATEPWAFSEKGRIFRYGDVQGGEADSVRAAADCVRGEETRAKFGANLVVDDFNGDGRPDIISALAHSDEGARLAGVVEIILA